MINGRTYSLTSVNTQSIYSIKTTNDFVFFLFFILVYDFCYVIDFIHSLCTIKPSICTSSVYFSSFILFFFCFFQVQYCCINNDIVLLFLWDDLQIAKEPRTVYIYYVSQIIIEIFVSFLIKSMFSVSFCWTIRKYIRFIILLGFSFSCLVVY